MKLTKAASTKLILEGGRKQIYNAFAGAGESAKYMADAIGAMIERLSGFFSESLAQGINIIPNPDFEVMSRENQPPDGWTATDWGNAEIEVDSDEKGARAIKLDGANAEIRSQMFPINPNLRYEIKVRIQDFSQVSGTDFRIYLEEFDIDKVSQGDTTQDSVDTFGVAAPATHVVATSSITGGTHYAKLVIKQIGSFGYTTIDGVHMSPYIDPDSEWVSVSSGNLSNGWVNRAGGTGNFAYWRDSNGVVHMMGDLDGTAKTGNTIYTLPAGYRPGRTHNFAVMSAGSTLGRIIIYSNGNVDYSAGSTTAIYLDQIQFLSQQ